MAKKKATRSILPQAPKANVSEKADRRRCGFCGKLGHNARSHEPGGRLAK